MTKFRNREGIQAVNSENRTFEALQGNYVDNGVEVSTDGTDMTLDVAFGAVVQDNEEHGIGATTVTVPDNNEAEPRKDIVYVDDTQSVEVATGASESPEPALEDVDCVFNTARPSPPSLVNQDDVVILAEVWVEVGATEITDDDLEDRRLTLGLETGDTQNLTDTETIDAPITNNNELVDFEGPNLFVNQNGQLEADAESAETDELATDATYIIFEDDGEYKVMNDNGNVAFTESSSTNAETAFQYTYDNLPIGGGLIYVKEGVYNVSGSISPTSDSTIRGSEGVEILVESSITRVFEVEDISNVTIKSLTIDSQGNVGDPSHGIEIYSSEKVKIIDVEVLDVFSEQIFYSDSENLVFRDCRIDTGTITSDNNYGLTSRAHNTNRTQLTSSNVVIDNCEVLNIYWNSIPIYGVDNFKVSNCYCANASHSAIACSPAQRGSIVGNTVENIDQNLGGSSADREAGIEFEWKQDRLDEELDTSFDVSIQGNVVYDCEVGIFCRTDDAGSDPAPEDPYNCSITGNSISNSRKEGIFLDECDTVVVTSNNIRDSGDGDIVETQNASNTVVSNNVTR